MSVPYVCPHCQWEDRALPHLVGREIQCPSCGHRFKLPRPKRVTRIRRRGDSGEAHTIREAELHGSDSAAELGAAISADDLDDELDADDLDDDRDFSADELADSTDDEALDADAFDSDAEIDDDELADDDDGAIPHAEPVDGDDLADDGGDGDDDVIDDDELAADSDDAHSAPAAGGAGAQITAAAVAAAEQVKKEEEGGGNDYLMAMLGDMPMPRTLGGGDAGTQAPAEPGAGQSQPSVYPTPPGSQPSVYPTPASAPTPPPRAGAGTDASQGGVEILPIAERRQRKREALQTRPLKPGQRYCPHCWVTMADTSIFCHACGFDVRLEHTLAKHEVVDKNLAKQIRSKVEQESALPKRNLSVVRLAGALLVVVGFLALPWLAGVREIDPRANSPYYGGADVSGLGIVGDVLHQLSIADRPPAEQAAEMPTGMEMLPGEARIPGILGTARGREIMAVLSLLPLALVALGVLVILIEELVARRAALFFQAMCAAGLAWFVLFVTEDIDLLGYGYLVTLAGAVLMFFGAKDPARERDKLFHG
jgi:DNA-directed RNA polymerase subunit RPC12/RpoP